MRYLQNASVYLTILNIALLNITLFLSAAVSAPAAAQEWTRFRGANGSGVSEARNIPSAFTAKDYNWQTPLPGDGHSSPVAWGASVFVTSANLNAGERYLQCIHAVSGKERWRKTYPLAKHAKHKRNTYASSTPACDARHVYVLWQSAKESAVIAVTHNGEQAWKRDLGVFKSGHGSAVSPVVDNGRLFLLLDHKGDSTLLALNTADGAVLWRTPRKTTRTCYSTPCIYQPVGKPAELVITHSFDGIIGVDPTNGKTLWQIKPFGEFKQRACASPVIHGQLVIGTSGFATSTKNVVAVHPYGDNGKVTEAYRISKFTPHVPTPLIYGGHLFLWSEGGIVTCFDAKTGEKQGQRRVGGSYFGSPICIEGRLFNMTVDGDLNVVQATPELKHAGTSQLGEGSSATPAVSGGSLLIRTMKSLISIGGGAS